jgi:hypothetical protein
MATIMTALMRAPAAGWSCCFRIGCPTVTGPIEYRASHLRKINPVGVTALLAATLVGSAVFFFSDNDLISGLATSA